LERVVAEFNGTVVLAKVDVDANPRISQAFGVQSIPTVVAIAGGQPVDAFSGALPEPQVRAWIQRLVDALKSQLPGMSAAPAGEAPPVDPRIVQAEQAMEEGDFDAAIAAYERYSADHPGDTEAKLAIAQLRFQQRAIELPEDAVERAAADPGNLPAQLDAAALLFAGGRPDAAYEALIAEFSRRADDEREQVQKQLLELFELQGQSDPLVIRYRRRLAAAMY
jgi:putative thioredoxin